MSFSCIHKTLTIEKPCFCFIFFYIYISQNFKQRLFCRSSYLHAWIGTCQWLPKPYIWPFNDFQRQIYQAHVFGPSIHLSLLQRLSFFLFILCHLTSNFVSIIINAATRGSHLTINIQQLWVVISFLYRQPIQPFLWSGQLGFVRLLIGTHAT